MLWEILVPTVRNNGKPFRLRYHRVWDDKVRAIANGLTVLTPVRGQWLCEQGNLFSERMIPVRIMCSQEQIKAIADMTAKYYEQLAVMYYLISDYVVIKHFNKGDK